MFIERTLFSTLQQATEQFPVVLLTGPRQAGKTALLKNHFSHYRYYSLDALDTRLQAEQDPRSFLVSEGGTIIDEIQEAPTLLNYVKESVDQNRKPGRFLLTGSHQFQLMQGVSQSLAGRVAILQLLPFSWDEIKIGTLAERILRGMYPEVIIQPNLNLDLWFGSYINTYLQRDLRTQINIRDLRAFETLLQLLAARIGQELNLNRLATEIGVSAVTVKAWISALEAAYIIYLLPPYFQNLGKRLIKSPKLYFIDTGLVCHLTKIKNVDEVLAGPLSGALFENFVVSECIKYFYFKTEKPALYFWRSHDGLEVDLVLDNGKTLKAIECKLSHTITHQHVPNLAKFKEVVESKGKAVELIVISPSLSPALIAPYKHYHWHDISTAIRK